MSALLFSLKTGTSCFNGDVMALFYGQLVEYS